MSFFDKKTDVIKIELTPYGKQLLAKGKFKPAYYEFFDNDILYDGNYASISEERNDIQNRIKNNTPYLKPQYNFVGSETRLKNLKELKKINEKDINFENLKTSEAMSFQRLEEKINITSYPLGTTKLNSEYPTIKIVSANTEISSSQRYTDLNGFILHIPQIQLQNSEYIFQVSEISQNQNSFQVQQEQSILLKIEETNVKDLNKNFEFELFEITSSNGKQVYMPLYFANEVETNDINSVEYHFEVSVDSQISDNDINKFDNLLQKKNVFLKIS